MLGISLKQIKLASSTQPLAACLPRMEDTKDYRYRIELIIIDTRVVPVFRSTAVVGPGTVRLYSPWIPELHRTINATRCWCPSTKRHAQVMTLTLVTIHRVLEYRYTGYTVPLVPEYSSSAKLSGSRILSIFRFSIPGTSTELENPEQ